MTATLQNQSTEYVYIGVTGDIPTGGPPAAEVAFMTGAAEPTAPDWSTAIIVDNAHALFADAQASGATGDYYVARLVGAFGGTGEALAEGSYQCWVRLTDTDEQPVLIAPEAVVIE